MYDRELRLNLSTSGDDRIDWYLSEVEEDGQVQFVDCGTFQAIVRGRDGGDAMRAQVLSSMHHSVWSLLRHQFQK